MTLVLVMTLLLSSGQLAQQEVPEAHCLAVSEAMARGDLVEIDGTDGQRHTVILATCDVSLDLRYDGPCEAEGS